MTITRIGSAVTVNATSTSGSQSITVPTGSDLCLVFFGGYANADSDSVFTTYSCSLGGSSFTHIARSTSTGGNDDVAVAGLTSPPSGSQTFSWDDCAVQVGPMFILVFYTGVDTDDPILDGDGVDGNVSSLTVSGLTTATGSMTVLGAVGDGLPDTSVSGQTTIANVGPAPGNVYLATGEKAEAASVSADCSNAAYAALVAVSLNPGTSGGGDVSPAAMMMGL